MPTLTLDKLWVNLDSTGQAVSAFSNSRTASYRSLGEVKQLAGGRQRGMKIVGEQGHYSFTILEVPTSDVDTLRSWMGETVQVRNDRGQVFVGIFFEVNPGEVVDIKTKYDVAISMRVVTAPEGV